MAGLEKFPASSGNAFNAQSGAQSGASAYEKLAAAFGPVQQNLHQYDVLKATKWVTEPGHELDDILKKIMALREDNYKRLTDPAIEPLFAEAKKNEAALTDWQKANLRLMQRASAQITGIGDMNFIAAMEDTMAAAEPAWLETLERLGELKEQHGMGILDDEDYKKRTREIYDEQVPVFERVFDMRRTYCKDVGKKLGIPASQVMLDFWNPYDTNADVEKVCADIEKRFPPLVKKMQQFISATQPPEELPDVDIEKQNNLAKTMLTRFRGAIGLTDQKIADKGITLHEPVVYPTGFCWGSLDNIRLSVEGDESAPLKGIQNSAHEYGHLVYCMSLNDQPDDIRKQPVGQLNGYSIHEVSAMFFEFAAQKKKFFELAEADIRKEFGIAPNDTRWSAENLYKNANRPSLESMEWGGCELSLMPQMAWRSLAESRIIDEKLDVADLADFRAEQMSRMTGLPKDKVNDVSQVFDASHWAGEECGYFNAYITGGMAAAMLHEKFEKECGDKARNAKTLEEYLRVHAEFMQENIYRHASKYPPRELLHKALGQPLSLDAYIRHLERGMQGAQLGHDIAAEPQNPPAANQPGKEPKSPEKRPGLGG